MLILERLKGLDHESTVRAYSNLATFYLECGLHSLALPFVRRSLYLERLVNGVEDQAVPQSMTNLAAVLKVWKRPANCVFVLTLIFSQGNGRL